jgi:hypothetical protein
MEFLKYGKVPQSVTEELIQEYQRKKSSQKK